MYKSRRTFRDGCAVRENCFRTTRHGKKIRMSWKVARVGHVRGILTAVWNRTSPEDSK